MHLIAIANVPCLEKIYFQIYFSSMPSKQKKKTGKPNYSQDPILYDHFGKPLEEVLKRDREQKEKKKEELAQVAALVSEARGEAGDKCL